MSAHAVPRPKVPFMRLESCSVRIGLFGALMTLGLGATHAGTANVAGLLARCAGIADPGHRLACYDLLAGQFRAMVSTSVEPVGAGVASTPAPVPPVALAPPRPARPSGDWRIDVGYTYGIGNHSGRFKLDHGSLDLRSMTGGSGGGLMVDVWRDGFPWPNTSMGLEYLSVRNLAKANMVLPYGVSILTDPVDGKLLLGVRADLGFLNFAFRPQTSGRMVPVIGGGLGIGYGRAFMNYSLSNDFFGSVSGTSRAGSFSAGLQAFAGVDVNLYRGFYFSLVPRVLYVTLHPVGKDQRYTDVLLNGMLGYRFD